MTKQKKSFITTNDLSYSKILEIYSEFSNNRYEKEADFVLSQNAKFSPFGNKIAFCQIINTWFKRHPKSKIRIYDNYFSKNESEIIETLKEIIDNGDIHTLLAFTYGLKNGIWGYYNKTVEYTSLIKGLLERKLIECFRILSKYNSASSIKTPEFFQIHPDFLGHNFFKHNTDFYNVYEKFYELKRQDLIANFWGKLFSEVSFKSLINDEWIKNIQIYFYEIFENALKWGTIDWTKPNAQIDKPQIENSIRAFFWSFRELSTEQLKVSQTFHLDKELLNFSKSLSQRSGKAKSARIMELSIIDNGLGIVQTFMKTKEELFNKSISVRDEYKWLINAFEFGTTSDTTSKASRRGLGLNKVLNFSDNLFCIIRTGHLYLYRNFYTNPLTNEEKENFDTLSFYDVSDETGSKDSSKIKKYTWAEGTSMTLLIPIM